MTGNKTIEVLQLQIDKLNQEQTENKWNEKDKKLLEKFLGLVHDDPFRIFYADGEEVRRILEMVYPESEKGRIEELFRIKYIYDGFLKYGDVVKPQIEVERPNLEILIKDISDYYLEVYRKRKKVKENVLKQCRMALDKINKQQYLGPEECGLIIELANHYEKSVEEKVQILQEILENNNVAMQELLKIKKAKKNQKNVVKDEEKEQPKEIAQKNFEDEDDIVEEFEVESDLEKTMVPIELELAEVNEFESEENVVNIEDEIEEFLNEEENLDTNDIDVELKESEQDKEDFSTESLDEVNSNENENQNEETSANLEIENSISEIESSYIEQYVKALEEIDLTDVPAIHSVLPKYHMPNFNEIMSLLIATIENQIKTIKEEEEQSDGKKVRVLREKLSKSQQLLKVLNSYVEKQEKSDSLNEEKIVDGETIRLLLLETEDGDCLIESDFKKQLKKNQYGVAMELLRCLEQFSDPSIRLKAKNTNVSGIQELEKDGVHIFFEPFAENTYIVIALLAEKNGYDLWVEDKIRLRHGLFLKQAKGMQRRWNQHGTRNTMLLGSETAYLEMQDMAEKR